MPPPLKLPVLQNWSCHSCAGCCRQHAIEITEEERQRIISQGWEGQPGYGPHEPIFVWNSGPFWKKRYRLAHRADGGCVFLDEKGLCRIHAKFGEPAKPLACRIYPYAFHPAGKQVTVSLRFSCPSVVANRGTPLTENQKELKQLERLVVPQGVEKLPAPKISSRQRLDWPDFLQFIEHLDSTLADSSQPIMVKLLRALFWMRLVGQSRFDVIQGDRLEEFLNLITEAAAAEVPTDLAQVPEPPALARSPFRLLVAQYARKDTSVELRGGWAGRWKLLRAALRFARGRGNLPAIQEQFREVPFETLEQPFGPLPAGADEIFTRYLRVKVQGLHFCGRAYYDVPLVEGFQSLALIVPATLYLARWLAASEGRTQLTVEDVSRALATADHHHGYSPIFGQGSFRRRVRMLAQMDTISKLCAWYAR